MAGEFSATGSDAVESTATASQPTIATTIETVSESTTTEAAPENAGPGTTNAGATPNESRVTEPWKTEAAKLLQHVMTCKDTVVYFVEESPPSPKGAKCRLPSCEASMPQGEHRIALYPAMNKSRRYAQTADFYHIDCFENLVDFSQEIHLDRVIPLTVRNRHLRNLSIMSIVDCHNVCSKGVPELVNEWKFRLGDIIEAKKGNMPDAEDQQARYRFGIIKCSGSSFDGIVAGDNEDSWNFFQAFLGELENRNVLLQRNSLSELLCRYETASYLMRSSDDRLTGKARETRELFNTQFGEKGVKAFKRLLGIRE